MGYMDFEQARQAHFAWKRKLSDYIRKPDGSLKSQDIACDDQCALGKWIYGDGGRFSQISEFAELKEVHANFHKAAAEIVTKADSGVPVSEEVALGTQSNYNRISTQVSVALMKIEALAKQQGFV